MPHAKFFSGGFAIHGSYDSLRYPTARRGLAEQLFLERKLRQHFAALRRHQNLMLELLILQRPFPVLHGVAIASVALAVTATVLSGLDYLWRYRRFVI